MRAWTLALPFVLTWVVVIFFRVGGPHTAQAVSNGGLALAALAAAVSCLVTAWKAKGRYRSVWMLLGLGMFSWAVGQLTWDYYEVVLNEEVPFPSFADAGYLCEVPLVAAALIRLPSGTRSMAGRARTLLDGLIVAAALLLVSWMLVLGTVFHGGTGSLLSQVLSLAYPFGDVITVTIVVFAILRARQTGRRIPMPLLLVGIGLVSLSIADSGFTYQTAIGSYASGAPIDTGWFAGFLLILFAARAPQAVTAESESIGEIQRSMGLLLPYAAVVLATVTSIIELARGAAFDHFVSWDRSLLIAFLVGRQILTLRENVALTRDLEAHVVEVRASEQRFEALVQNSSDVVTVIDADGVITYQSESLARVFGHLASDLKGRRLTDLMDAESTSTLLAGIQRSMDESGRVVVVEVQLRHGDGHSGDTEIAITNLLDDVNVGGVVLNSRDISERKVLERQLVHQAYHDSLTALANRALFRDRVNESLDRTDEEEFVGSAVLYLDLDGFKEINDSLGHANGDMLLTLVAHRLRACVRPNDMVARLGGDEFAILLEGAAQADAHALAARILSSLNSPFTVEGREVYITASIGIASTDPTVEESGQLLRNADLAMYRAKSAGGGAIEHYDPGLHAQLLDRMRFEDDLRKALGRGELRLFYQPIMDLQAGRPVGFEALARWQHPTEGLVTPDRFIGIAEKTGLIQPIGRWVLHEACRQAMIWRNRHPEYGHLAVSVNISARQFQSDDLIDDVANALEETGLPPSCLELEMTESVLFEHSEDNIEQLSRLKALGVRIAIDDFGTGYSSLAYLHRFSVDVLKIDRTFISQLTEGDCDSELVRNILQIGQSLHMVTIAEGIETEEQSALVTNMGCELGQGYFYARPLPVGDVDAWLAAAALSAPRTG
jgi:diguanylate cyclase (GGDEF)-like protein/PAS domain S-box-containing protein